jgi:hypothetical protein
MQQAIPVVVRCEEWVCSSLTAVITGSNTAEGMDICRLGWGLSDEMIVSFRGVKICAVV